jgi:Phosphodiester glycosidase
MKNFSFTLGMFLVLLGVVAWTVLPPSVSICEESPWRKVDEGLAVAEFDSPMKSNAQDSTITVVRIDPKLYSFKLLCASEHGRTKMTARKWCEKFGLIAAVNAGMYQQDGFTNVGLMKTFNHINNARLNNVYKAVLAFNPSEPKIPEIQIIDLKCQDFDMIGPKYQTLVQNIRMIGCRQENVWAKTNQLWGMAVFGIDKSGNGLLVFTEAPYSGHDFASVLLSLPLSIFNALYLEGGFEANLFFSWNGVELERVGTRETGLQEDSPRAVARPIPNVIGITKKRP